MHNVHSENITDGVHEMSTFTEKHKYSVYFMLLTLSGRSFIKLQYTSFPLFPVEYPFGIATHYNITSSMRSVRLMTSYFHLVVRQAQLT